MKPNNDYSEGTCFAVPLRDGGFALGLVARSNAEGCVFGYFFGPKVDQVENLVAYDGLTPEKAILAGQFGDLGLIRGEWPVLGQIEDWVRESWPMPLFVSEGRTPNDVVLVEYDEDTLTEIETRSVSSDKANGLHVLPDRLMGYGAVEIRLSRLLSSNC